MYGSCAQVGRPGCKETGAPEDALCMTTIKSRDEKTLHMMMHCTYTPGLPNPITDVQ
jgi:hypothetical protein